MDDILSRIVKDKRAEVEENKIKHPLASFADRIAKSDRDFKEAIRKQEKINLIAELKFSSPAKNQKIIPTKKQIEQIAQLYNKYAEAISVITDEKYFGGSPEYLKIVRKNTDVPVLRKDFIIDKYQVYESRLVGADAILLIASVLEINEINEFLEIARSLNMDCLVEAHTVEDIEKVLHTSAEIIGINNRNLKNMEIDLDTTIGLAKKIPGDILVVSQSGIKAKKDIEYVSGANVDAVLVGTSIMENFGSKGMEEKLKELS